MAVCMCVGVREWIHSSVDECVLYFCHDVPECCDLACPRYTLKKINDKKTAVHQCVCVVIYSLTLLFLSFLVQNVLLLILTYN